MVIKEDYLYVWHGLAHDFKHWFSVDTGCKFCNYFLNNVWNLQIKILLQLNSLKLNFLFF